MIKEVVLPGKKIFDKYCYTVVASKEHIIVVLNENVEWSDRQHLSKLCWKEKDKNWYLNYLLLE